MSFPKVPIGAVFEVRNGATPASGEERYWEGEIPWVTPADLGNSKFRKIERGSRGITPVGYSSCGTQLVPSGSIVLSTRAPIGHLAIAGKAMCFNQGCRGLVPRPAILSEFAYWVLYAWKPQLESAGQGTTFVELGRDKLRAVKIPLPDLATQQAIADFLDRETARIDQLIEKKQRLVQLLEEDRKAYLDRLICGHANCHSYVPVDHLTIKSIPSHWKLVELKYLTDQQRPVMYGIVLPGPNVESGVMIVKGGDVKPHRLNPKRLCKTTVEIESSYARSRLRQGDLVIAIRGGIGDVEIVPPEIEGANLTQDAARIAPRNSVNNRWLRFALLARSVFAPLEAKSLGAAVRGINIFDLKRARVPLPPKPEQDQIADKLELHEERTCTLRQKVIASIERLREYRSALITAAVTGQVDVSGQPQAGTQAVDAALAAEA